MTPAPRLRFFCLASLMFVASAAVGVALAFSGHSWTALLGGFAAGLWLDGWLNGHLHKTERWLLAESTKQTEIAQSQASELLQMVRELKQR